MGFKSHLQGGPVQVPCSQCGKKFPESMLYPFGEDDEPATPDVCAVCGLTMLNICLRVPLNTQYPTKEGRRMHAEAVEHLKRTGQWEDGDGKLEASVP